jgi:pimeloyl-ACP methyl ester carboxylesterase
LPATTPVETPAADSEVEMKSTSNAQTADPGPLHLLNRRLFIGAGLAGAIMACSGRFSLAQEVEMTHGTVTSKDGTSIAFDRSGTGPALILVGGALSERSAWAPLAKLLAPHFTVVAYDRRGRGDSGDTAPYAVDREIEDIEALIDDVGGTAFIHGQSSGAVLSLEATVRLPEKVLKLSLYEPPYIIDDSRAPPPDGFAEHIDELIAADARGEAVEYWMTDIVGAPAEMVTQMKAAPMWPALEGVAHTLPYDIAVLGDGLSGKPLPAERWADMTAPVLVMDGGASPAWIRHTADTLAASLPYGEHKTLAGQAHSAAPEILAPELDAFFSAG